MSETPAVAFLRRVRSEPQDWPHHAIVAYLLSHDPVGLAPLASRALVAAGVLLPTEVARRRVAERIAFEVVRGSSIPDDHDAWLESVAYEAAHSLRLDGLDALAPEEGEEFLRRLASCLGIDDGRATAAHSILQSLPPAEVAALRTFLPASWTAIALTGCPIPRDAALATAALRAVVRASSR